MVRIGTLFSELIEECGGFSCEPSKIIAGGPMTGIAQHTLEVPVTKGVTGIWPYLQRKLKMKRYGRVSDVENVYRFVL